MSVKSSSESLLLSLYRPHPWWWPNTTEKGPSLLLALKYSPRRTVLHPCSMFSGLRNTFGGACRTPSLVSHLWNCPQIERESFLPGSLNSFTVVLKCDVIRRGPRFDSKSASALEMSDTGTWTGMGGWMACTQSSERKSVILILLPRRVIIIVSSNNNNRIKVRDSLVQHILKDSH